MYGAFADHLETSLQPFALCGDEDIEETTQKKSPGYDKIDADALPANCIEFLMVLMNQCLRLGHFLSQWKCAEVILIQKPGKPKVKLGSYRSYLLAILSKILEKLFLKRLLLILEEKRIIPDHQFGFRQWRGAIQVVPPGRHQGSGCL